MYMYIDTSKRATAAHMLTHPWLEVSPSPSLPPAFKCACILALHVRGLKPAYPPLQCTIFTRVFFFSFSHGGALLSTGQIACEQADAAALRQHRLGCRAAPSCCPGHYTHTHMHTCTYIYICICVCVCVCIYIYIYIHIGPVCVCIMQI